MASIQTRGGKTQVRVAHALLDRPHFATFSDPDEARAYAAALEAVLDRGIVPVELLGDGKRGDNPLLKTVIEGYLAAGSIAPSDRATLDLLLKSVGGVRLLAVTAAWADAWVGKLKTEQHLGPGTIRKRVESLARAIDHYWRLRMGSEQPPANPLRLMPRGYSAATAREAATLQAAGKSVKRDTSRDRRLTPQEVDACRAALMGAKRDDRERALPVDPAFALLFELILNTGLRLSEAYSLRADQIDLARWVINVAGSKGHRGLIKPRVVPMVPALREPLAEHCRDRVGLIFPFWNGAAEDKKRATGRLSHRFATMFGFAKVGDCTEHDLRHEATCRWFELRRPDGHWVFSEIEICKIMGWSDPRMCLRYASLRGEDLSARLG